MEGQRLSGVKRVTPAGSGYTTLLSALMTPLGKCVRETDSLLCTFSKISFLPPLVSVAHGCVKRKRGGLSHYVSVLLS